MAIIHSTLVYPTDFSSLNPGQLVADNTIKIGQFQLQLPAGNWTVLSTLTTRPGSQMGSSAAPTQLWVAIAQTESAHVKGLLVFRTPASTFIATRAWSDNPCGSVTGALVKDTMQQTLSMPECFTVTNYPPTNITSATEGLLGDIAKWLKDSRIGLPENILRVYYSKYHGGDFLHAYMYLPGTPDNFAAANTWGRSVAQAIQKMVIRESSFAALPPLPQ